MKDIEHEFNPRAAVGNPEPYLLRAAVESERARSCFKAHYDVRYGDAPLMTCDVFPATSGSPILVFIHGGYWRGRDKADYSFLASTFVPQGVTVVIANYDLCPTVKLGDIVDETVTLFHWIASRPPELSDGWRRLIACGHSAGAHLIAMANAPCLAQHISAGAIDHALLISGIYDIRPVRRITVNSEIGLTDEEASTFSPMDHPPHTQLPIDLVVGGAESVSWIEQSRQFARRLVSNEGRSDFTLLEGHNHYSIMEELMDNSTTLSRLVLKRALGN